MEPSGVTVAGSTAIGAQHGEAGLDFGEEIQRLMAAPPESASSFTALLELPAPQAVELLHHAPDSDRPPETAVAAAAAVNLCDQPLLRKPSFPPHHHHQPFSTSNLTFLLNLDLIERAAKYSVFAGGHSPETSSVPSNSSANLDKVKNEPAESDSNPNSSQPPVSDPTAEEKNQRPSAKRKEREKKAKASAKKSKNESSQDAGKLPYVHVRARRGQATDSHSLAERARREKINARMKLLQELVPGCNKISGTALVLDEIINHVQSLQRQVEPNAPLYGSSGAGLCQLDVQFLSMRLAAVNPRIDFNLDSILPPDNGSVMDGNLPSMVSPTLWPEFPINESRQQFQQQWHFDLLHQPLWGRDDDNQTFVTPENSLLTYDSTANSASLHSSQLKMEL